MRPFRYERASGADDAVALAGAPGAAFLAGGTNLVDLMKLGVATPEVLVDLGRAGLGGIDELAGGGLRVGAAVTNSELAADARVRSRFPVVSQALVSGASGQLRNLATTGGNLLQRTRCRYFMDATTPCDKRAPGTGCPAREGDHRNLAILGASRACVATHPSDMAVAMVACDAAVALVGAAGTRTVAVDDLYRLPGDSPERDTVLEAGELLRAVELPALPAGARSAYRKARDRASYSFALGSVAAVLAVADGTVRDVRLALGAVAPKPWRARAAEAVLRGSPATAERFAAAADAELEAAEPLRDNAYKVPLVRGMIVRTLCQLAGDLG